MGEESSPVPAVEHLRALAAAQGVYPDDNDLEGVMGFLTRILPALRELEERLPEEATP
ncbi:MAG: hypothetical protein ACRDLU_03215 [Gaiellaceae bacterium]